jgi:hypothetical protein
MTTPPSKELTFFNSNDSFGRGTDRTDGEYRLVSIVIVLRFPYRLPTEAYQESD